MRHFCAILVRFPVTFDIPATFTDYKGYDVLYLYTTEKPGRQNCRGDLITRIA